jgi:diketogulonate reductase-like aldo/keto reductase
MILQETFTLSNGVRIPRLGLGTWMMADDEAAQIVRDAAELGYRHFDTAQAYANERGVGEGLRASGVPRDEVFVTTKLEAACKTYSEASSRIDGSLTALGLDEIDLMLIHSPQPWSEFRRGEHYFEGNLEAWRALEEAHRAGKLRAIGVSNFEQADLDNILDNAAVRPAVNQILAHVGNTPFELIEYSQSKGVLVEAYSPVAHGAALKNRDLAALAEQYGVSVAQLCIRYCLQLGMVALPKTLNREHLRANADLEFEISADDMDALKTARPIHDYGEASVFPVFGEKNRAAVRNKG